MASKRPPSSRSMVNKTTMPPLPQRSRSVMSKSASSSRSTDGPAEPVLSRGQIPKPTHQSQKSASDQDEINIQVIVRCRGRSEREANENSPTIVSYNGAKSNQLSIETTAPSSTLGIVTLPPTRTYPFDLVFGSDADQAMIYHEVVSPMLDQVLQGYNCTLFAYGQTGTGKTYTMQGELEPTPMGNPHIHAGMIPRVLFRLFHHLETNVPDYTVKVSYIELYNEELRDLLAPELSQPTGNIQPMGKDGKNNDGGLKLFDDASKRGVVIQGVEEVSVQDCKDALTQLRKGSLRRQIAATKFNDHSSRSHSIFAITVHTKILGNMGEELLSVGKLNLVDLAGSENIGRSGAENTRAREAGMINQSLLTLGRVITALVDKAQHIPYRESKLTRLLQDSLGGRTKTCLIATISPSRSNLEETLSTLDYALRAKSIRNKPELNQRMTRNSLLKEYVGEIERLKSDLMAAREKNGIFFSEETWNQMTIEQELQQTEMIETKKQVTIAENQLRAIREEYDQSIGLLGRREEELKETRKRLEMTINALSLRDTELLHAQTALREEIVMRQAFERTETALDTVAVGLRGVAHESLKDVEGLFAKLDRKTAALTANSKAVAKHGKILSSTAAAMSQRLDGFVQLSSTSTQKLENATRQFEAKEIDALNAYTERTKLHLKRIHELVDKIHVSNNSEEETLESIHRVIRETTVTLRSDMETWGKDLQTTCRQSIHDLRIAGVDVLTDVDKGVKALDSTLQAILSEASTTIEAQRNVMLEAQNLAQAAANSEIKRVRQQNQIMAQMLEDERIKGDKAKNELLQRITGLLGDFIQDRDQSLREIAMTAEKSNKQAQEQLSVFSYVHSENMDTLQASTSALSASLSQYGNNAKRTRDGALKSTRTAQTMFTDRLQQLSGSVSESVNSMATSARTRLAEVDAETSQALDKHSRVKRARLETSDSVFAETQSELKYINRAFGSSSRNIQSFVDSSVSAYTSLANMTDLHHGSMETDLSTLRETTRVIRDEGARDDRPTGKSPQKRVWEFVDKWELTGNREDVLKSWRDDAVAAQSILDPDSPTDDDGTVEVVSDDMVDQEMSSSGPENVPPPIDSPVPLLAITSTDTIIPPIARKPSLKQKAIPSIGTLVDTRNVYTTRRAR